MPGMKQSILSLALAATANVVTAWTTTPRPSSSSVSPTTTTTTTTTAAATRSSSSIHHRSSSTWELHALASNDDDVEEEESSSSLDSSSSSSSRRDFFHAAASKATTASLSLSLLALSTTTTSTATLLLPIEAANAAAADSSTSTSTSTVAYSKIYTPAPHSMDGKIVVITGGNTGLGLESTKRLAGAGATVVFTSRSVEKGKKALDEIDDYLKETTNNSNNNNNGDEKKFVGKAMVVSLDLCDLENVKSFDGRLAGVIGKDAKVDVLMNNAGVMAIPDRRLTKDGYEKTFQTNHLGHFALTSTILPLLAPDARVINVSSMGYQFAAKNGLELDNLNGEREYAPWTSYGLSKLENILFTNELQRRARESERWSGLTAFSLHPGAVQTDLARYLIGEEKFQSMKENGFSSWKDKVVMEGLAKFVKTVEEGASTQVFLAAAAPNKSLEAGRYFSDGKATPVKAFASDAEKGRELWSVSENLSGVKFEL